MSTVINFPSMPKSPHYEELPTPQSLAKSLGCNVGLATYYHNKMKQYKMLGYPNGKDFKAFLRWCDRHKPIK
jgi:hypothetical protein